MTLYPCPMCGHDPEVVRTLDEEGVGWVIQCLCTAAFGRTEEEAERLWNRLYCSNDPATVEDCE